MARRPLEQKLLFAILLPAVMGLAGWLLLSQFRTKPHLLIVTLDTVRSDHCSAYGSQRQTTPRLDEVARQGVRFETAYAPMATTGPSHATMFTSLYPLSHGVLKNGHKLRPEFSTLAEILSSHGYATAAFVSAVPLHSRTGLNQGFSIYEDRFRGGKVRGELFRRANETTRLAVDWLRDHRPKEKPFFLWVHYYDPHAPYDPPEPYRSKFRPAAASSDLEIQIAAYDGEIHFTDYHMGLLLDLLDREGLTKDTLVVITADHGEGLMQHGHMGHGLFIYEEAVKVPLVLRWPKKIPSNKVVTRDVQLLDLIPTILGLLTLMPGHSKFHGISLVPYLNGTTSSDLNRHVFLQRRHYEQDKNLKSTLEEGFQIKGNKFGVRTGSWKYIEAEEEGTRELYDLNDDPYELNNLYLEFPNRAKEMAVSIRAWRNQYGNSQQHQTVSPEDQERLKALGYIQ